MDSLRADCLSVSWLSHNPNDARGSSTEILLFLPGIPAGFECGVTILSAGSLVHPMSRSRSDWGRGLMQVIPNKRTKHTREMLHSPPRYSMIQLLDSRTSALAAENVNLGRATEAPD